VDHLKHWSAISRINTEGKSLIMKLVLAYTMKSPPTPSLYTDTPAYSLIDK